MIKLIILLVVCVIAKQAYGDEPEAIVGGSMASPGQFPHQISLQYGGSHMCGGSIIGTRHVLSAAHCVENMNKDQMKVMTGSISSRRGSGQTYDIQCIQIHPGYTGKSADGWKDDICLITLTRPITLSNVQNVIPLATRDYATGSYRGIISGFGWTSPNSGVSPNLLFTSVNTLSRQTCLNAHPKRENNAFTNANNICTFEAYGKGACYGDSGGPLVINGELCGVASWVVPCALGAPDVFTAVFPYRSWISQSQQRCMIKLAILLVVGVIAKQAYGDEPEAIVGGSMASSGQFPHQISLQYRNSHICGGSIISPQHVLTAAHCVENLNQNSLKVMTGSISSRWGSGQTYDIRCIQVHPGYTGKSTDGWKDDICLITLTRPITMSNVQNVIPLASMDYTSGSYRGIISGFGKTSTNSGVSLNLLFTPVNTLTRQACLNAHPRRGSNAFTNPNHICTFEAYGKGACQGDSGGPLVINGQLCGVTSWVVPCAVGYPDVFTGVWPYRTWISQAQQRC
ncbi:transmembrane protease serine 9-like [Odontomachus brunneus]|uniref:transmembrane protease serine 9-like n=1 Tax=Odontomachus brunneus TaxID=486640 RepID=UPI0013F219E5|nr:transmembrane protease serine 9-like [Odontomachus brunneus]